MVNGIIEIVTRAILSILGLSITYFITISVAYLSKKREALIEKIGVEQYNKTYNIAKSIYFAVEQQFKFIPESAEEKRKLFDEMLLKKIPSLKEEDLYHFREAIVGEINSQIYNSNLLKSANSECEN
ncbi:hypothetical protein HGG79_09605 [Clostridium tetanomorphum]|uniref:Phage protein n=1 Tax=Clostridium tetanomorphum TaxID=1553 RepID=A0A923ECQ1_CLOTT|nr:hypothetical protein [Clostridium tetanomorphum]